VVSCVVAKRQSHRSAHDRNLVKTLSTPAADLHVSALPAFALQVLNLRRLHELAQTSPADPFRLPRFGNKSLKEIEEKRPKPGLTLDMTLQENAHRAAVLATVAAGIRAARGCPVICFQVVRWFAACR
jgi:hypothetical protein